MDLRDLGFFEVIAELGHLGRASERLGRTQPALSKCIQRLESEIGAQLFARGPRGVVLTPVGEVLLARAKGMRTTMEASMREVSDFASGAAGHVRLGIGATLAEHLLPQVAGRLMQDAPGVTLDVMIAMNAPLRQALKRGEIDIAIGPIQETDETGFQVTIIGQDEVVVVAAYGHPLLGKPVGLADLVSFKWVLPVRGVAMRDHLDQLFGARGLPAPSVQIEANSIVMLPRLITETNLLTYTSTRNLAAGRLGGIASRLDIEETTMRRKLGTIRPRDTYVSPATLRLERLLEQAAVAMEATGAEAVNSRRRRKR